MHVIAANGANIPAIGLGTFTLTGATATRLVAGAIAAGYRHIDTAAMYDNEREVGDWRMHVTEGALFLWLWCEGLPITSADLYERLKQRGVLVVSGHYFFPGLKEDWPHRHECIRVTYAQDDTVVEKGLAIITDEIRKVYATAGR